MKRIDWNKASELGLIERINREVLHPLGLAMYRIPETGESPGLLISDDGEWQYAPDMEPGPVPSREEVQLQLGEDD